MVFNAAFNNISVMVVNVWYFDLKLPMQSVSITTSVVSSNPAQAKAYSIKHVIKYVSDLQQVGGFLRVLRFPSQIKLTPTT